MEKSWKFIGQRVLEPCSRLWEPCLNPLNAHFSSDLTLLMKLFILLVMPEGIQGTWGHDLTAEVCLGFILPLSLSLSEGSSQPVSSSLTGNGGCVFSPHSASGCLGPQMTRAEIIHARLDLQVNLTFPPSPLHHCMSQTGKQIWGKSDKRPPLCEWSDGYIV